MVAVTVTERGAYTEEFRPPRGSLPGEWEPPEIGLSPGRSTVVVDHVHPHARLLHQVLSAAECRALIAAFEASGAAIPVSVSGHAGGDSSIGSVRATAWAPSLASALWSKVRAGVELVRTVDASTPTDWFALGSRREHRRWRAVGIGPVLRFMRYERGGHHCAHYDAGFDYPDLRRSLMSVVFYLTGVELGAGGRTRIVDDGQGDAPVWERDHADWTREVEDDEVVVGVRPLAGAALLFDHRLCHDVELYRGDKARMIVRGDLVYEALDGP